VEPPEKKGPVWSKKNGTALGRMGAIIVTKLVESLAKFINLRSVAVSRGTPDTTTVRFCTDFFDEQYRFFW
jgi:hypothetical protein